jgi:hypothetical protein
MRKLKKAITGRKRRKCVRERAEEEETLAPADKEES